MIELVISGEIAGFEEIHVASAIPAMNPQQMPRRPQPIAQSETRLPHRPPLGQRVLADAAGELAVRTELPETQIQLDVEQPGRHEVIGKERVDLEVSG